MTNPSIAWAGGGEARFCALEGELVTLVSSVALAPGARVSGSWGTHTVRVKSHGSKRNDEGFEVRGRLLDCTRELREAILAAVAGPST